MIVRNCAGGVVFWGDQVFLLKNDKGEWVLPKGVIRDKRMPAEVALERVKTEAGVCAQIVSTAGDTNYEFYSLTRRQPVKSSAVRRKLSSPALPIRVLPDPSPYTHRLSQFSPSGMARSISSRAAPVWPAW